MIIMGRSHLKRKVAKIGKKKNMTHKKSHHHPSIFDGSGGKAFSGGHKSIFD